MTAARRPAPPPFFATAPRISSLSVFHSPQPGHCPIQRGASAAQAEQTKTVVARGMGLVTVGPRSDGFAPLNLGELCASMLSSLLRYAPVAADLDPAVGVLDVGCGQLGLGSVFGDARFAGQDTAFTGPVTSAMFAVRTAPGRFPWADAAFDTVVCLDTLAKVEARERDAFVAECARVTARRLLIACTTDNGLSAAELEARCTGVEGFARTHVAAGQRAADRVDRAR